jgi:ABC-2 type transport system ATP-binding protein
LIVAPVIETNKLVKCFENLTAVDQLTLSVEEGEILALLGPNGAGKTTTVRMLSSILKPTSGSARVAGYDVAADARRVRQVVGQLTEFPGLYLRMRALDYLAFFGELHGMAHSECRERSEKLLRHFDLWEARDRRLGEYSKGMRQKIALIRCLLHNPRVLFLDEPTSAMDPHSAKQVRDAVAELTGSGRTIILCTHNLHEAESLADRIAVIRRGRLIALGTPEELKRSLLGLPIWELKLARPLDHAWPDFDGQLQVQDANPLWLRYRCPTPQTTNPMLLQRLHELDAQVLALSELSRSLEQVYLKLVQ